ncbi:hypothetical protein MPSEU_000157800 [Mayamaea pseudoterrestris]|nr:hypothetical protein MPSEU_000157800 [Mayamaea pseudoterrestris]
MSCIILRTVVRASRYHARESLKQARGVRSLASLAAASSPSDASVALQGHFYESGSSNATLACFAAATIASIALAGASDAKCESLLEKSCISSSHHDDSVQSLLHHQPQLQSSETLEHKYVVDFDTVLGQGSYGCVHPAYIKETGELVALKKISRKFTSTAEFENETSALLRIYEEGGHPNINRVFDMYEDDSHFYVLLELVAGGEMLDHVVTNGAFCEADAARLIKQLASSLEFLHNFKIVHGDIKPENILLSSHSRQDGNLKLIDFGCAVVQGDNDDALPSPRSNTKKQHYPTADSTGTTAYWAPERFLKSGNTCDAPMDMWAVGVILFIMLNALHPFDLTGVATDEQIERQLLEDPRPPLDEHMVGHLSASAVDLLAQLMHKDPSKRMTASEMLKHPWVMGIVTSETQDEVREPSPLAMRSTYNLLTRASETCATGSKLV